MMMNVPLTLVSLIERAETYFAKKEVVSRTLSGVHRLTYKEVGERTRSLSSALEKLGVVRGDRVGTLAWNDHRHLEAYFAVPCMGAVLHTINVRLPQDHLSYIINHAQDKVLLIDPIFVPLIEKVRDQLIHVEAFVIMSEENHVPETSLSPVYCYETLLSEGDPDYSFADDLHELEAAGTCYTSATTGKPKGVVYTHRSTVLHSYSLGWTDTLGISESDVCLPIVPMFHVNAWGMPYACTLFGSKLVLPGPDLSPGAIIDWIEKERVTFTGGVPTVWLGVMKEIQEIEHDMSSLRAVVCGGSAAPKGLIQKYEQQYGIPFVHAYGMTETSPIASVARLKSYQTDLPYEEKLSIRSTQGMIVPGLESKVVDENGEVARNGEEMGELLLRGHWIADDYYEDERSQEAFRDGWLHTGDIVTMDEEGNIRIVDRTKDLVKSGGEWISSVELENALMAHEAVFEAAVIAVTHPKWQERPVACIVLKDAYQGKVSKEEFIEFLRPQFAKWWLPDDVVFLDEIPRTSVGKFLKRQLREDLKDLFVKEE